MKKLKVIKIDNYLYTLEDEERKIHTRNFEFLDTKVDIGDYIYIDDNALEENNIYTYGKIEEKSDVEDYIKIIHNNNEIYLQRYYG